MVFYKIYPKGDMDSNRLIRFLKKMFIKTKNKLIILDNAICY